MSVPSPYPNSISSVPPFLTHHGKLAYRMLWALVSSSPDSLITVILSPVFLESTTLGANLHLLTGHLVTTLNTELCVNGMDRWGTKLSQICLLNTPCNKNTGQVLQIFPGKNLGNSHFHDIQHQQAF